MRNSKLHPLHFLLIFVSHEERKIVTTNQGKYWSERLDREKGLGRDRDALAGMEEKPPLCVSVLPQDHKMKYLGFQEFIQLICTIEPFQASPKHTITYGLWQVLLHWEKINSTMAMRPQPAHKITQQNCEFTLNHQLILERSPKQCWSL